MNAIHLRVALAGLFIVAGCTPTMVSKDGSNDAIEAGRVIYRRRCAACHGLSGHGDGPVASALRTAPPDLTRLAETHSQFPREHVVAVVSGQIEVPVHGTREMPIWSQQFGPPSGATAAAALWNARQLELLMRYLEALQEDN
jgi:mono/diheme cytochrome c family protein